MKEEILISEQENPEEIIDRILGESGKDGDSVIQIGKGEDGEYEGDEDGESRTEPSVIESYVSRLKE